MSRPIALCADSTCDLGEELCARYQVHLRPYNVVLGDEQFLDGVTLFPDQIFETYRAKKILPRTAAINVADYEAFFRSFLDEGMDVIHVTLGHGLSSSYNNCRLAAEELAAEYPDGGRVYVVDSRNLSSASGMVVMEAGDRIAQGMDAAQVAAETQALTSRCHASFTIDTLEFLYKGGRCSALAMLGANMLKIKPCIEVNNADGTMTVGKKYRGNIVKVREQYVRDKLVGRDDIMRDKIFITHSGTSDENVERVRQVIQECGQFDNIYVTRAGCTISSHCGPETLGVLFMTKE